MTGFSVELLLRWVGDLDRVTAVLEEIGRQLAADPAWAPRILEPAEVLGVQSLDDSWVTMRPVVKCQPGDQWAVGRELRRRIKDCFQREGIDMPYPQQVVYVQHP